MPASGFTIPASDVQAAWDASKLKPLVLLQQSVAQSIPNNANTALNFDLEDFDPRGWHAAGSPSRIVPIWPVAAYYHLTGWYFAGSRTDYTRIGAVIGKNGSVVASQDRQGPNAAGGSLSVFADAYLTANGTTDYFELFAFQQNSAAVAVSSAVGGSFNSTFRLEYVCDVY